MMKLTSGCVGCFAGLSCDVRIDILNLLQEKSKMSVLEITKHFQVSQPTITHHLLYLKEAGLLSSQRQGKKIFYFINPKCGKKICQLFS